MSNLGARLRTWKEANQQRIIMTSDGPLIAYNGEFVMVIVGRSLEECRELLCPMLQSKGDTK